MDVEAPGRIRVHRGTLCTLRVSLLRKALLELVDHILKMEGRYDEQ